MANPRQLARQRALQALYSWQLTGGDPAAIDAEFRIENDMSGVDLDYFRELLREIPRLCEELDGYIVPLLSRPLNEVDPVERAILRLGAYELKYRLDVPYRVAINEGVDLAKTFGAEQGHRFINGILDGMARNLRAVEQAADERPAPPPAAVAGAVVGKGKFGQKRAPLIMTASRKKAVANKKATAKKAAVPTPSAGKQTAGDKHVAGKKVTAKPTAGKPAPAKKAASRKPAMQRAGAKKSVAKHAGMKQGAVKQSAAAKPTAHKPASQTVAAKRPLAQKATAKPMEKQSAENKPGKKRSGASLYAGKGKASR